jgi:hypothetical protein
VVDAVFVSLESADLIFVVDAAHLRRDRAIKKRRGNFNECRGGGIEVNNETVFVPIGIKPESGSLIKVIDAQKVLVRTSGGGIWIKDRCKHAIDILPAKLKAVLIRPKPDDDGHVFVVNADGLGLSDRMARWRRPREVLHRIVGVRHENVPIVEDSGAVAEIANDDIVVINAEQLIEGGIARIVELEKIAGIVERGICHRGQRDD